MIPTIPPDLFKRWVARCIRIANAPLALFESYFTLSICTFSLCMGNVIVSVYVVCFHCLFLPDFCVLYRIQIILQPDRWLTYVRQGAIFLLRFPFGSIPAVPPESCQVFACCIRVVTPLPTFLEGKLTLGIHIYSFSMGKEFIAHVILSFLAYTGRAITPRLFVLLLQACGHSALLFGCLHVPPSLIQSQCLRPCPAGEI